MGEVFLLAGEGEDRNRVEQRVEDLSTGEVEGFNECFTFHLLFGEEKRNRGVISLGNRKSHSKLALTVAKHNEEEFTLRYRKAKVIVEQVTQLLQRLL